MNTYYRVCRECGRKLNTRQLEIDTKIEGYVCRDKEECKKAKELLSTLR